MSFPTPLATVLNDCFVLQLNLACFVCDATNRSADDPTSGPSTTAELLSAFEDFGSNIRSVLGCIEKPMKWYINIVWPHLPTFVKGRVALLGDAVSLRTSLFCFKRIETSTY